MHINTLRTWLLLTAMCVAISVVAQDRYNYEGHGTEDSPYLIESADRLKYFAKQMDKYENYSTGKHFKLTSDIVLNTGRLIDENGELACDTAQLYKWQPIGKEWYGMPFAGVFDGDGHKISGMYIDAHGKIEQAHGLFAIVKDGVVKNLTIDNSFICGYGILGSVVGLVTTHSIENCTSYATVQGEGATVRAGGIVGDAWDTEITNCANYGRVSLTSVPNEWGEMWNCAAGGIVGNGGHVCESVNYGHIIVNNWGHIGGIAGMSSAQNVTDCINYGLIELNGRGVAGGIIGGTTHLVARCINQGEIIASKSNAKIGGVCGELNSEGRIEDCVNRVDMSLTAENLTVGGVCGYSYASQFSNYGGTIINIKGCINYGSIAVSGAESMAAGICGVAEKSYLLQCSNHGSISAQNNYAAGICAIQANHSTVRNCRNMGDVAGYDCVGGITARTNSSTEGCFNSGNVCLIGENGYAGGILGKQNTSQCYTMDCVNIGQVQGGDYVGGIVGSGYRYGSIRSCSNGGTVIARNDQARVGGIAGSTGCEICDSYNIGNVLSYGNEAIVGGVVGDSGDRIVSVFNAGWIVNYGQQSMVGNVRGNNLNSSANACYYVRNLLCSRYSYQPSSFGFGVTKEELKDKTQQLLNATREDSYEGRPFWVEGYYHPLAQPYYSTSESYIYEAKDREGHAVMIDLCPPFGNEIMDVAEIDVDGSLARLCYNSVNAEGNVLRGYLVDGAAYTLDRPMTVESIEFVRFVNGKSPLCLPFDTQSADYADGAQMYIASKIDNNMLKLNEVNQVAAGQAFMVAPVDTFDLVRLSKGQIELKPIEPVNGVLTGVFVPYQLGVDEWPYSTVKKTFVRPTQDAVVGPFSAYLTATIAADEIAIEIEDAGVMAITSSMIGYHIVDNSIYFDSPCHASLMHIDGRMVSKTAGTHIDNLSPGIYILVVEGKAVKVKI